MGALASVGPAGSGGKKDVIVSSNPASGEVLGEVREMSAAEIRDAVSRARGAQAAWGALPVKERCERVGRFRDLIVARAEELCALISAETGKTRSRRCRWRSWSSRISATYFIKRAPRILAPEPISLHLLKNRGSYLHYRAARRRRRSSRRGTSRSASPPGEVVDGAASPATRVVLKPSEVTPLIALKAKELYDASGMPDRAVPGGHRARRGRRGAHRRRHRLLHLHGLDGDGQARSAPRAASG